LDIQKLESSDNNSKTSYERDVENRTLTINDATLLRAEKEEFELSIIIPVYNQGKEISNVLSKTREIINTNFSTYELIVVDDGSTDNTLASLEKEQKLSSNLRLISYPINRGKGYAVREGVLQSKGTFVVFIDSDLEISPDTIKAYINAVRDCDLVIASKTHPLSIFRAPISRRFLSKAFNFLVRSIIGMKYKDTQSGLKVGKGEMLRTIFKIMLVRRYAFDVELLALSDLCHLRIREMPADVLCEKGFKVKEIIRMALDIARITYRLKVNAWYYKQLLSYLSLPGQIKD
jgi:glycosyltransferase involved in cell wall biosynthesis